jgi:hypothetical protein
MLSAVTPEAFGRLYPPVNPVLKEIVPPVREPPVWKIRMLDTRQQFIFISVAVRAERNPVARAAQTVGLRCVEPVPADKVITVVEGI